MMKFPMAIVLAECSSWFDADKMSILKVTNESKSKCHWLFLHVDHAFMFDDVWLLWATTKVKFG